MRKFYKLFFLTFTLLFINTISWGNSSSNNCKVTTYIYAIKGNDTLKMDLYQPILSEPSGCVIFLFGGGFVTGERNNKMYKQYFYFLANNGYTVASIDYRLGLKDFAQQMSNKENGKTQKFNPVKFTKLFLNSIDIAVSDLYSATNYILNNYKTLNINPDKIIISGSSAGAITVLQGEYFRTNWQATTQKKNFDSTKLSKKEKSYQLANMLPHTFKYSGVISFAGAIASTHGKIEWLDKPAPIQMFHGNADSNVPYYKLKTILGGFYGSKFIANQLQNINSPFYFYTEDNKNHIVAVSPMKDNLEEILNFLQLWIVDQKPYFKEVTVGNVDEQKINKKFTLKDYVKSNFKGIK